MGKHGQIVMGPAGAGKSTYCRTIYEHCRNLQRSVHVINLDPAAEEFGYDVSVDIKDLVTLEDVMQELNLGPNGGLVHCMEYLVDNMDWLEEEIGDFGEDYLIFDCPGQIELYMHIPVMRRLVDQLQRWGYQLAGVYLLDSHFMADGSKFMSGMLTCMSSMVQLELPQVNVITKMDILKRQGQADAVESFLDSDIDTLVTTLDESMDEKFHALNLAIAGLIQNFSMVSFVPLDISDEESIGYVLSMIDQAIQYGEDLEIREPRDEGAEGDGDGAPPEEEE